MDSLVTQGLIGLVFVLSIALWSKSSSSTKSATPSSQKNKKKKKKGNATASSKPVSVASSSPPFTTLEGPLSDNGTLSESIKVTSSVKQAASTHRPNGKSNGSIPKAAAKSTPKKEKFKDFVAKTNEERIEELEREARGNADEKDLGKDMIDKDLQPEIPYKKVVRIEPVPQEKSYAAVSSEDGWESVGGKAKAPAVPIVASTKESNSIPSNAWASSNPFALLPGSGAEPVRASLSNTSKAATPLSKADGFANGATSAASQAQTKRQRQNAAKTQAKKLEKEAMEVERLARLAQHKREVEAQRIKEFYKKQTIPSKPFSTHSQSVPPSAKVISKASVNEKGSLVWD